MTQRLVSIGDDYYVEDEAGQQAFIVDGKALRVRNTLQMRDLATGDEYSIQEKIARVTDTMVIEKNGERAATVKRALVTPIRDRFIILMPEGPPIQSVGNILNHEYRMIRNGNRIAGVSKKWFRLRDTYGVEVSPEMDAGLAIACTVALDVLASQNRNRNRR
ncbi:LURP-one-related/scramblase family protein [Natrinema marinum]|uniref:LURP-one-related/scramblase family protein n=1 Tax=Natrinema marinum TaxID=2961598 RepID=UPI0020C8BB7C|nr:LURP-one-related family protein [Natrinema marinum]